MTYKPEESLEALIEMGSKGHYPLFYDEWLKMPFIKHKNFFKLTGTERTRAKKLFALISKHKRIEHKRTIISAFEQKDRELFIKAFMNLVQSKAINHNHIIQ